MADLIDRQALGVGRCSPDILPAAYCAGWNGLLNLINEAPTVDAVEVVRCRDCKHRVERGMCYMISGCPELVGVGDNFWCAYGERRGENDKSDNHV